MNEKLVSNIREAMINICIAIENTVEQLRYDLIDGMYDDYIQAKVDEVIKELVERECENNVSN